MLRDTIDLVLKVLTFLSTAAIAVVGLLYTDMDRISKERQDAFDMILKSIALTNSDKTADQDTGILLLNSLGDDHYLAEFSPHLVGDKNFKGLLLKFRDIASSKLLPPTTKPDEAAAGGERWVYLGQYQNGAWQTHYLDGIVGGRGTTSPAGLVRHQLTVNTVTGAVNLRSGPATATALMPVIATARPGTKLLIGDVKPSGPNPQFWGRVDGLIPSSVH
ncbi:MAG TPA: hypothetical protein VGF56_16055 [Rhizomicrobium sp.]